jgi:hypothetical protein
MVLLLAVVGSQNASLSVCKAASASPAPCFDGGVAGASDASSLSNKFCIGDDGLPSHSISSGVAGSDASHSARGERSPSSSFSSPAASSSLEITPESASRGSLDSLIAMMTACTAEEVFTPV